MNHRSIFSLLCLALSALCCDVAKAEFVTNGSMTGPAASSAVPSGWSFESDPSFYYPPSTIAPGGLSEGGVTVGPQMPASPHGGTFVVISADMLFRHSEPFQEIACLTPGQSYTLSFYYANAGIELPVPFPNLSGSIEASIAGQTFATDVVAYDGPGQQIWRLASFDFVATSATERLAFETGAASFEGAIDGVSIVPEPGSSALAAMGLAACVGFGLYVRRADGRRESKVR